MSKINVHKATVRKFNSSRRRTVQEERACCGEPWLVLADPSDSTSWKNDRSLVFEKCDELTVTVQKKGAILALPAQGVSVTFPNDPDTLGFVIDWRLYYDVDNELIQGQYDVFVETVIGGVTERYLWNTFMLLKYTDQNAEGTVRIFSYFNHYSEEYDIDFSGSGALDTVRFRGFFGNRQPNYETKNNTEISKKREKVFNKSNNVYGLIVEPTVECKTLRIEELHLLNGSVMYISDHNDWNHNIANEYYKDKPVILSNDESPEFDYFEGIGTKYAKVLAKFKDKISKRKSRNTGTGENVLIPDIGLWNGVVCPSGGECDPATAVLVDTATPTPNIISETPIASGASANIVAPDGIVNLRRSTGALMRAVNVRSNQTLDETIANATVQLKDALGTNIGSSQAIPPESTSNITAPDGTVTINRDGVFFATQAVRSNGTATVNVPSDCPVVNPQGGLMPFKTGQTTVYRTGDDGTSQRGQAFFTLPFNNLHGNTNRFRDVLGGATYADGITVDHSTIEWATPTTGFVMMYVYVSATANWDTNVDNALAATHGGFIDWEIINGRELESLGYANGTVYKSLNHSGLSAPDNVQIYSGTTNDGNTAQVIVRTTSGVIGAGGKTGLHRRVDARRASFSISGAVVTYT